MAPSGATDWKLTLKDTGRSGFSITTTNLSSTSATVEYAGAQTGTNEYISAMIVDNGSVAYYGRIKSLPNTTDDSGTITINIPSGVTLDADTTLRVFNEQFNGDRIIGNDTSRAYTDYASELLTVTAPVVSSASIGNATVSGTTGTAITPVSATITLTNEKFNALAADTDVSGWFTNLPAGLAAKIKTAVTVNATAATVTFSGTPTVTSAAAMTVTIPAASLVGNADLAVTPNANAKWAVTPPAFIPVTNITGVPTAATTGVDLTLTGTVAPADATSKTIVWSLDSSNTLTGASIADGKLVTTAAGTAKVKATITNGATETTDYTQVFEITVSDTPTPPAGGGSASSMGLGGGSGYMGNAYQGNITANANGALVCTVQADCKKCTAVILDGVQIKIGEDCTVDCGSTIVTVFPSCLAKLKDGAHTLRVQFTDGRYDGTFTTPLTASLAAMPMADVPATGEPPVGGAVWAVVLLLAGLGLALSPAIRRRKRKTEN